MATHPFRSPFLSTFAAGSLLLAPALAQDGQAPAGNDNGFLTGLRGFENFHEPLGQPIYFESPFNDSGLRLLYLKHDFSDQSTLQGGDVTIYALQARLAITDRLAFIATKDGYSELDSGIIEDEGWNDIAGGFKYVLHADKEKQYVVTPGIRYMAENGHRGILQGGADELSPFVSLGKGYDDLHLLANLTLRVPMDGDEGNTVGHWDLHVDYDVNPGQRAVVAPLFELHGVHYLDDGASALNVGGLDYTNLGSTPAEDFVCWAGVGARVEIDKKFEFGACYEFALTDPDDDIMDTRITVDFIVRL
ncbi:MAG: hypothetical protein JNL08_02425 [Planctomycetes bacterium]|nr:hypothetical protein [Planctomycetota bacterium]